MAKDNLEEKENIKPDAETTESEEISNQQEKAPSNGSEEAEKVPEDVKEENMQEKLESELSEAKDKYLRLYSEFENFRRRTARERLDLIKTANEDLVVSLLPILDDFERAFKSSEGEETDGKQLLQGFELIANKFKNILEQKGLKTMDAAAGKDFDPDTQEAVTQIPAPEKKLKGKIVDVIEKGYYLEDKVIRFAKVVTGA